MGVRSVRVSQGEPLPDEEGLFSMLRRLYHGALGHCFLFLFPIHSLNLISLFCFLQCSPPYPVFRDGCRSVAFRGYRCLKLRFLGSTDVTARTKLCPSQTALWLHSDIRGRRLHRIPTLQGNNCFLCEKCLSTVRCLDLLKANN